MEPYRKALKMIRSLLSEIQKRRQSAGIEEKIEYLDIGGGLLAEEQASDYGRLQELGRMIKLEFADLSEQYIMITEFGQYIHTHNSWLYSRVADILPHTDPKTLIIYQGANMFVRQAYTDQKPPFEYYVMGKEEASKNKKYDLAGPLCFSGDYIEKGIMLPSVDPQDAIIIDHIGANTYALWSEHCSWEWPKVIFINH